MMMPGRTFSSGNGYRYGFNGKEQDSEVKGTGTQYDYGFRIYDPRLAKFMSVDPLTASYPALTPYQFATNNPIEGIDLDGLEYVSSKQIRIKINNGVVSLNIENMTTVVRNMLKAYNNDPKNWAPDRIGADLSIGRISLQSAVPQQPKSDPDPSDANPNNRPQDTKIENPNAKSSGLPDRRYKERTVTTASPSGSRWAALAVIAVDAIITGANFYVQNRLEKDQDEINKHIGYFKAAAADVNYALKNTNLIPKDLQTDQYLSDIISVVLSGTSNVNNYDQKKGAQILEIGKKIYDTYSTKRSQYTGRLIQLGNLDGNNTRTIMEPNPYYDANYVNQNPPLGDPPKQ